MIVTAMDGGVYRCEKDGLVFHVAVTTDQILMYGDSGSQVFSYCGDPLHEEFPDRKTVVKAATLHTRGVTDRRGFLEDVKRLHAHGEILYEQLVDLEIMIKHCNCAPIKFIQKLFAQGYGKIVGKVRLYEETPLLKQTVDLFMEFLAIIKD